MEQKIIERKIRRCEELVIANDKIAETLFYYSEDEYRTILEWGGTILEKRTKTKGKVMTPFKLQTPDKRPLTQFDRAVLSAVMSHYYIGNVVITANMIYRTLCGKFNKGSIANPTPAQRDAILQSIDKMSDTNFKVDLTPLRDKLNYVTNHSTLSGKFLPTKKITNALIGNLVFPVAYQVLDTAPSYFIANIKKQLLKCPVELLEVPGQHNGIELIAAKHYVLQRVLECKRLKKSTNPTITVNDVFNKCDPDLYWTEKKIRRLTEGLMAFFEHLVSEKIIGSFEKIIKRGNVIAVTFER